MITPDEIQAMKKRLPITSHVERLQPNERDLHKLLLDREELEREIDSLRRDKETLSTLCAILTECYECCRNIKVVELTKKFDSLRRDAERYRHLRDLVAVKDGDLFIARKAYDGYHSYLPLSERDSAIDAAIAQERKGEK